jgi:hypothetical protein
MSGVWACAVVDTALIASPATSETMLNRFDVNFTWHAEKVEVLASMAVRR